MFNPPRLLIVIATYNERESLPTLVSQLHAELPTANILVIDDNSPDGTGDWCHVFSEENPFFSVIRRTGKLGLGSATRAGLKCGVDDGFEFIATLDADLSHDPIQLRLMFDQLLAADSQKFGAIIGSRYVPGGRIVGWPWYRRLSSTIVNGYSRIALRLSTRDNTSAFRIYRTQAIRKISIDDLQCNGYAYLEEILLALKNANVPIAEVPITFQNRDLGKSKVNFRELAGSLFQIVRLSLRSARSR